MSRLKLYGYARISKLFRDGSPDGGRHESESCEHQKARIAEAALRLPDYDYAGTWMEKGRSAFKRSWRKRKVLMQLTKVMQPGDAMVVTSMDRLSREVWTVDLMRFLIESRKLRVYVLQEYGVDRPIDISDPIGHLIFQIHNFVAAQYSAHLSKKMYAYYELARKTGKKYSAHARLGYKFVKRVDESTGKAANFITPDIEEASTMVYGIWLRRKQGYGWVAIGHLLNQAGKKRRTGKPWMHKRTEKQQRWVNGEYHVQAIVRAYWAVRKAEKAGETSFAGIPLPKLNILAEFPEPMEESARVGQS